MKKLGRMIKHGFFSVIGIILWKFITYNLEEQEREWHERSY